MKLKRRHILDGAWLSYYVILETWLLVMLRHCATHWFKTPASILSSRVRILCVFEKRLAPFPTDAVFNKLFDIYRKSFLITCRTQLSSLLDSSVLDWFNVSLQDEHNFIFIWFENLLLIAWIIRYQKSILFYFIYMKWITFL
jgi:hypothetical protein